MAPADELVEVIDADGNVERVVSRAEMRAGNLRHRNVAVVIQRSDGRLVVHQRADWKDVYPSLWDVAFGGVPAVGEPDAEAAVREVAEEAGVTVTTADLRLLGRYAGSTDSVSWVGVFFLLITDAELFPADGEVAQMVEVPMAELGDWGASHPLCPDVAPLLIEIEGWLG